MAGRSEIIAILSSGVSYRRFLVPYFIGGVLLTVILWIGYQYVVPKANLKWGNFEKNYVDVNKGNRVNTTYRQNIYFRIDANSYAGIKGYDTISKSGNNFFIQRFSNNKLVYNLRAASFSWNDSLQKWKLSNVMEREIKPLSEVVKMSPSMYRNYNFKPLQLRTDEYLKDQMTTQALDEFITQEEIRGSESLSTLLVERYNRDAIPMSVLILTFIGAVLASRKVRGGSGAHLAIGVVISVVYVLFSRLSVVFATKGDFPAWLAAWTPNIIFGLLAFYLYRRAPK
jgi:lipopolysaccharide export system permease protein